ncbi:hypothetical protein D8S78_07630 [Natrialba swarupiae]|nr:hypothetical protein [Natrialba swarupiae]
MRSKLRRRQWLTLCTSASLTSIAGCTGGDDGDTDDDENRGRTADEQFDGDTDDDENSGRTADEQFDGDNDRDPIELDIDPSEGWATVHADVAVPDNRGRPSSALAVRRTNCPRLGSRVKFNHPANRADRPRSSNSASQRLATSCPYNRSVGDSGYNRKDRPIGCSNRWRSSTRTRPLGEVRYGLLADGSHSESSGIGLTTQMDESFVRVDRSGVVTARGEFVTDDRGKDAGYSLDGPLSSEPDCRTDGTPISTAASDRSDRIVECSALLKSDLIG